MYLLIIWDFEWLGKEVIVMWCNIGDFYKVFLNVNES